MKEEIELLKQSINEEGNRGGDWRTPYEKLIQSVYNQHVLFFALSKNNFNMESISSIPMVGTKDFNGAPSLYIFSDVDIATIWMRHYKHVTEDLKYGLIGAVEKENNDFLQIFQIAKLYGVEYIVLDEGGLLVAITMDDFFDVNKIESDKVYISAEKIDRLLANEEKPTLKFPEVCALPLTR